MSDRVTPRRMMPERWSLLEPLIDAALDLAPDRRPAFYDEVGASDPELRAELERLLGRSGDDDDLFRTSAAERFARLLDGPRAPSLPTDVLPQLQESLGTAYTIERELGGGGMSRVFLAHQAELGRRVVIKVLPPELAAGMNAERFEREIKLAASLQQANIVPLLATGRAGGYPYYTMPFVEGRSLRDRLLREGVLPIGEAVNLLRDIARALAYAHAQGVVHRDIKPGNVLLSGGTAVVTDFGIAKAIAAAVGGHGPEGQRSPVPNASERPVSRSASAEGKNLPVTLTNEGSGIGTPLYMAPEQAAGDPAMDHRVDIYAFGCLAYEVFTGKPPFQRDAPDRIIAAHARETPRPVTEARSDVPPAIAALIARCLEKHPRRRPQSAAELLQTLDVVSSGSPVPARHRPPGTLVGAAAVALAMGVGATAYLAYRSARADAPNEPEPLTLAAIPFRNVSADTAIDYRADGISREILTAMGKVPGIRIVGRNAARRYTRRDIEEGVARRELGAAFLVTGTYEERGGHIVVSTQLSDLVAGRERWGSSFESAPSDLRSLPDSIARIMADTLHALYGARVGQPTRGALSASSANPEAFDDYLDGQSLLGRRQVKESVRSFEAAIRLDSNFAQAHAALATALTFYPWLAGKRVAEVKDSVLHAANRALGLDSALADAHSAIAMVYAAGGEWDEASKEFQQAVALEPDNFDVRFNYGRISTVRGDLPEALHQFEQAKKLGRTSSLVAGWSSYAYFLNSRADSASALKEAARAFRLDSLLGAKPIITLVNLGLGHVNEARRLMAQQTVAGQTVAGTMSTAAYGYAKLGDTATAMRILDKMDSARPRPWSADVQRATVMLAIGDTAQALSALEQSARTTGPMWVYVVSPRDPAYDPIRHSLRFANLVRDAGLDVAWMTAPRR